MELAYTLHEVHRGKETVKPGSVELFDRDELRELIKLDAVRQPTEEEVALYKLTHPEFGRTVEKTDDAAKPAKPAKKAKTDTSVNGSGDGAGNDPDVTDPLV